MDQNKLEDGFNDGICGTPFVDLATSRSIKLSDSTAQEMTEFSLTILLYLHCLWCVSILTDPFVVSNHENINYDDRDRIYLDIVGRSAQRATVCRLEQDLN